MVEASDFGIISRRLLTEVEAAQAVGVELATFRHWVQIGHFPAPLPLADKYDVKAINAALDRMSGLDSPQNAYDAWRERYDAD